MWPFKKKKEIVFCIDCKHFIMSTSTKVEYGYCTLHPQKARTTFDTLVTGKKQEPSTPYKFASIVREFCKCGKFGKQFEPK